MDFYGTAVTAITQIYQITVFIKGIRDDVKDFDDDRAEIRLKLDIQLSTLWFFRRIFFNQNQGLMVSGRIDPFIANTVERLLVQMRKTLAEYEIFATKYSLIDDELIIGFEQPELQEASLLERVKSKARSLKLRGVDWSLFEKKKVYRILNLYTEWSENLRNIMQHMTQEVLTGIAGSDYQGLKSCGLEPVMKRREIAGAKAPTSYRSLTGIISEAGKATGEFHLAKWSSKSSEEQVIVEYHEYENMLKRDDLEPDEIEELKEPIRNLAWLLQSTSFSTKSPHCLDQPKIYALECLGFIDQPTQQRSVFLYQLPPSESAPSASLTTLHAFINAVDSVSKRPLKRPSLNDRFSMAYSLSLTISNVHASAWVHKNIWSRGILLFLETSSGAITSGVYEHRLSKYTMGSKIISYLSDWGYARSIQQGTDMRSDFEVEPNFYRHPSRQGRPTQQFSRLHDIYALGVILLEIGLWGTISRLMAVKIKEAESSGRLPKPKKVVEEFLNIATQGLPKEMGMGYTNAVLSCLKGEFRGTDGPSLAMDFQEKVVSVLKGGIEL
ncbi:hypothetical protein N7495_001022 [Penicillium taxi]|uniref:uncharacterized protein n=1 Tax=Penicillium taxi TaxID=168475 RepID=UPI002544D364|nr:uncharacterized protein N7495_001022 [Penicillium taxi]KAJ5908340.1 hypothetical protein N7495_001022 [Penicillium taxi]